MLSHRLHCGVGKPWKARRTRKEWFGKSHGPRSACYSHDTLLAAVKVAQRAMEYFKSVYGDWDRVGQKWLQTMTDAIAKTEPQQPHQEN